MERISRRAVVAFLGAASLAAFAGKPNEHDDSGRAAPPEAEKWMDDWMRDARSPEGALYLGRFADPIYFLTKPITWKPNRGQERYKKVTVPVGFVTDLASVPRVFW